jgi:predicted kinase
MRPTFVIFSGLPGTGKSVLADRLAREMQWPLLRIDDVAACFPAEMEREAYSFWDQAISSLLRLAEVQLKLGISVIADSIFMNLDRYHALAIARQTGARFMPVYTFISDQAVWEQRVRSRFENSDPAEGMASWEQVLAQREGYRPWEAGTALFLDAMRLLNENYAAVRNCADNPQAEFQPIGEADFSPGKYHG